MRPDTLTELERLQLVNQYAILEKLDKENAEHYQECQTILKEGYAIEYGKIFDPIYSEMSRSDSKYVMDVLEMYQALGASFEVLADKQDITKSAIAFPGFSGNEETRLLCYARYLKDEGRRWSDLLKTHSDNLDGHFPSTFRYEAMLERWNAIGDAQGI